MAKPQIEDGYTQIANELLEAFAKIRISGEVWQCINVIIRKTYGFKKTEDWISLSQFVNATGIKRPSICRALNKGIAMNIINKNVDTYPIKYGLQKDHSKWIPLPKKVTKKVDNNVNMFDNNDNEINNNDTPKSLTKKIIQIDNNVNGDVTIKLKDGVTKKLHTKTSLEKKPLQKKVLLKKELSDKIKTIKKEFNEFVKIRNSYVIEQAVIVFAKPFEIGTGFDPFMDYWIRKEVGKMRDWIDEKTDKSQYLKHYDIFIAEWFKREKPYPAFITSTDESIYYEMKGSSNVG